MYNKVNEFIIDELIKVTDNSSVFTDEDDIDKYSRDETEDLRFAPEVVVKPSNTNQVSGILKIANFHSIPVVPRGGGTGLSGGALAVNGGICLSMERFNRIIEIDENNFQATVEPGVITQVFQEECEKKNLFYPPDPASRGSCFLGGNVAECAGGPRAAKYGVTREYILGLEFVLPNGDILTTGSKTLKNVTGYNLTQLLIGSEGTLAVITKIYLKLKVLPKYKKVLLISFSSIENCISSVTEIYKAGINPSALEFLEKDAVKATEHMLEKRFPNGNSEAHLMIELDGNNKDIIDGEMILISDVLKDYDFIDIIVAESRKEIDELWELRRKIGEAVKSISVYKEEDTVVPRSKMTVLLKGVKDISKKYGIRSICYGHAGDGNLHINILKDNLGDKYWTSYVDAAITEIFKLTVSLGGTISGEHGIGYTQKKFLNIALMEREIELMKSIKKVFDPNNILNTGKIFL